ncbi:DUF2958 domain-containing protein [Nostoc sp. CHAB 5844]|nr:DUF2958 domain-containing protein [Nostoc sp. CHAB 5844]
MELLTAQIRAQLPALYAQEHCSDAIAYVKFFTPDSNWTWYVTEFDGEDTFFSLVQGHEEELGYFSLSELVENRGPWGLPIERDLYFKPTPLSQLRREQKNQTSIVSSNITTDDDGIIIYNFTDADSEDPTNFINFMMQLLGDN